MICILLMTVLFGALSESESGWSDEVVVRQGPDPVVRIQARVQGGYLMVRVKHEAGWHTYAMDNELRATAALKGRQSLGVEEGMRFEVVSGLDLEDRWLQTEPKDLSQPELRWFTYGFEETAWFACRVRKIRSPQVVLRVRGQACSGETCCQIDETLELPSGGIAAEKIGPDEAEKIGPDEAEKIRQLLSRLVSVATKPPEQSESNSDH